MCPSSDACIREIDNSPCLLARIRNYQSAGTASSQAHLPTFCLTNSVLRTITNSSHAAGMVEAANAVFTRFEAMVHSFPNTINAQQQTHIVQLQNAVRILWRFLIPLPQDPRDIIALAAQFAAIQIPQYPLFPLFFLPFPFFYCFLLYSFKFIKDKFYDI